MEALEEQQEAENCRHTEARRKKPAALSQRVHQKHADKHRNRCREGNGVVGSQTYQTRYLKLTQHETNQSKRTVQRHKAPQAAQLAPAHKVALGLGAHSSSRE